MELAKDNKDASGRVKTLVPLNTLPDSDLKELLANVALETLPKGEFVFRQGDKKQQNVYLLSGTVALLSDLKEVDTVDGGSDTARFAIAHQFPRMFSVRAKTNVTIVRIDSRMLNDLLSRHMSSDYEVSEIDSEQTTDWMTRMLQSGVFQQIPAHNIQRVIMRMEEIEYKKGDVIIRQGEEGDYYYIIKQGRCSVIRRSKDGRQQAKLAELVTGDSFGEEALLSGKPRNTTITMLSPGVLLRLTKEDFVELIQQPVTRNLTYQQAADRVANGALWLDVRDADTYEAGHLDGSINMPINSLRLQAQSLAPGQKYVCCCQTGDKSATAAFLLTERGFDVWALQGGLQAVPPEVLAPVPADEKKRESAAEPGPMAAVPGLEELAILRDELAEMHELRQAAEQRARELQKQVDEMRTVGERALQKETDQLNELMIELEVANDEIADLRRERDEALGQAKQAKELAADLEGRLAGATAGSRPAPGADGPGLQGRAEQLKRRVGELEDALDNAKERENALRSKIESMEGDLELTRQLNDSLSRECESLQAELKSLREAAD